MKTIGRLLRLSLTASALADAAVGVVLGAQGWPSGPGPFVLLVASAAVYHGGMALNDWADREHDARTRPDRPIPSGAISAGAALALALGLLGSGCVAAWLVSSRTGATLTAVAVAAALYDLAGRGPWRGPLLLGLCRAGNLGAGVWLGSELGQRVLPETVWILPGVYGLYVFLVSRLGRLEDGEDRLEDRSLGPAALVRAFALLLLAPGIAGLAGLVGPEQQGVPVAACVALALGAAGAFGLFGAAARLDRPRPEELGPLMGLALRRLLIFTAATAVATGTTAGWVTGLLVLAGYPLSHALRRVFPPS